MHFDEQFMEGERILLEPGQALEIIIVINDMIITMARMKQKLEKLTITIIYYRQLVVEFLWALS